MKRWHWIASRVSAVVMLSLLAYAPARGQPGPNLAGKTVQVIVGFGTGGGYDQLGRLVARHLGRHLPGKPTVVVQNMPGGGSYTAANHIYSVAPKDGTAIALISGEAALGPDHRRQRRAFRSDPLHLGRDAAHRHQSVHDLQSSADEGQDRERRLPE